MLDELVCLVKLALYDIKYESFNYGGASIIEEYNRLKNGKYVCIHCISHYINDRKHGKHTEFYPDGKIDYTNYYVNGHIEGQVTYYYSNGRVWKTEERKYGMRYGPSRTYSKRGKLLKECHFYHDILHGKKTVFYKGGTSKETRFIYGMPDYIYYRNKEKQELQRREKEMQRHEDLQNCGCNCTAVVHNNQRSKIDFLYYIIRLIWSKVGQN